jgi:hypothetical protein
MNQVRSDFFRVTSFAGVAAAILAIAGCSGAPKPDRAFEPQLAKSLNATATEAAVAKPGTKVCRWVPLGIAERDLIRGVVQQAEGADVRVRIDDPGRFPSSLNGYRIRKGEVISDAATAWTPCVF